MAENTGSWSGLTDQEAEEFHKYYMQGAMIFTVVAIVAHLLVLLWRPWIPGPGGYASVIDSATSVAGSVLPFVG
ncbi:MAG: light-harvesting antenna LH1, beta subunit [Pseudomonadota bacterium]